MEVETPYVEAMLALCWLTFRSWARLGRFFRVWLSSVAACGSFGASWRAPGSIFEGPGALHGGFAAHMALFFEVFCCMRACAVPVL